MANYRTSPLTEDAAGTVEHIARWDGHTMGGRVPAFLGLAQATGGVYLEREGVDVQTALRETGLDFDVRLETVYAEREVTDIVVNDDGPAEVKRMERLEIPRYRATVGHRHDGTAFAMSPWVSPSYTPFQNTDALQWGHDIVGEAGGRLVAVGAYGNPVGCKTYAAFDLGEFQVGGKDTHDMYLTVTNAHDGSGGLAARVTPIRLACTNETSLHFGKLAPKFQMKHTRNIGGKAAAAREALQLTLAYKDTLVEEMEGLLGQRMTENEFIAYSRRVFGVKGSPADWKPRTAAAVQAREDVLVGLWNGDTVADVARTRYAGFQVIGEYADHLTTVRSEARRYERLMEGSQDALKQRAFAMAH